MWKARFLNRKTGHDYWKTIWANDEPEANKISKRFARKGYICASCIRAQIM